MSFSTHHIEEPLEHMANTLENMTTHRPPDETDADDHEPAQDIPEASSSMSLRVMATEDALMELIKITSIHTKMLKDLQTANTALAKQLEANQARLDQLDVKFRALREAQTMKPLPKCMCDPDKTANDLQLLDISPNAELHTLANGFVSHPDHSNTLVLGCTEFRCLDMSNLATTLALVPQPPSNSSQASSRSSSCSFQERRKCKPHREEHVKRSRVTYDSKGGQTPNIPPPSLRHDDGGIHEKLQASLRDSPSDQSSNRSVSSADDSEEDDEYDESAEPSLTSWLYVKAAKALFGQ